MQITECSNIIKSLYELYGKKSPTNLILKNYFEFLKKYSLEELNSALKIHIKKSKFLPTIQEIVELIEDERIKKRKQIIYFMQEKGYFGDETEFKKANNYIEKNVIPNWFKRDYTKYYEAMKNNLEIVIEEPKKQNEKNYTEIKELLSKYE